jgi:hypothetical protein
MRYLDLTASYRFIHDSPWDLYVIGGPGLYYRRVEVLKAQGTNAIPICDPWLGACFPGAVPAESVLGRRTTTNFGASAGLGLDLRVVEPVQVFLEARYHFITGPQFEAAGVSRRAIGHYVPVMLGIRF